MNKLIRCVAGTLLLVVLAGCGTNEQVKVSGPASADVAAARVEDTTTTAPPAPEGVPLAQVPIVAEGSTPMHGPIKMNTVVYEDSVFQSLGCGSGFLWVYDLNRAYTKLTAVVGIDDYSIVDDKVTVAFKGDNNANLGQIDVSLGVVAPIELPVTGVLRLRVEVTRVGGGCIPATGYGSTLGMGDAKVLK